MYMSIPNLWLLGAGEGKVGGKDGLGVWDWHVTISGLDGPLLVESRSVLSHTVATSMGTCGYLYLNSIKI